MSCSGTSETLREGEVVVSQSVHYSLDVALLAMSTRDYLDLASPSAVLISNIFSSSVLLLVADLLLAVVSEEKINTKRRTELGRQVQHQLSDSAQSQNHTSGNQASQDILCILQRWKKDFSSSSSAFAMPPFTQMHHPVP